jgi:hypothetical protein
MGISTIVTSFARGRQYGIITPKVQIENMTWTYRGTFVLTPTVPAPSTPRATASGIVCSTESQYVGAGAYIPPLHGCEERVFKQSAASYCISVADWWKLSSKQRYVQTMSVSTCVCSRSRRSTVDPVPIAVEPKRLISWDYSQDIDSP